MSADFCQATIRKFEAARETTEYCPAKKCTQLNVMHQQDAWGREIEAFEAGLSAALDRYLAAIDGVLDPKTLLLDVKTSPDTGFQIQKTAPDGASCFDWHDDSSATDASTHHRVLSYIWYLNTLDSGHTQFKQFAFDLDVRPEAGKLLMFPSTWTYLHRGTPVLRTSGPKYIVTGFVMARNECT